MKCSKKLFICFIRLDPLRSPGFNESENRSWNQILEKVHQLPITTDEHVFKMVHVCHARCIATATTATVAMATAYKRAAITVVDTDGFNK
jgi:hypothetical protein